jgi:hypothetical protein
MRLPSIGLALLTLIVVPVFYVSIAASVAMPYEALGVTFSQALDKAIATPFSTVVKDDYAKGFLWFVPFALSICVAFIYLQKRRASNYVLIAGVLVPAVLCPFSLIVGVTLPLYLVSPQDGETWGEAWPAISAIGFWIFSAFLLGIYHWRTRNGAGAEIQAG